MCSAVYPWNVSSTKVNAVVFTIEATAKGESSGMTWIVNHGPS